MNPEITQTSEIKRGHGHPKKQPEEPEKIPSTAEIIEEGSKRQIERMDGMPPGSLSSELVSHPTQSLGDLYASIDAAPPEWLPSLLAKIVKTSLKSGAWSDVENLILSVRGFAK